MTRQGVSRKGKKEGQEVKQFSLQIDHKKFLLLQQSLMSSKKGAGGMGPPQLARSPALSRGVGNLQWARKQAWACSWGSGSLGPLSTVSGHRPISGNCFQKNFCFYNHAIPSSARVPPSGTPPCKPELSLVRSYSPCPPSGLLEKSSQLVVRF